MSLSITTLYAGLLGLIYLVLVGMVGAARSASKVSLGDGGDRGLVIANRRHMNFVENVPLALILIALIEAGGANKALVHALGAALTVARVIHPFGINPDRMNEPARIAGAAGTLVPIAIAAATALWLSLR